jgi:hypothetical protein
MKNKNLLNLAVSLRTTNFNAWEFYKVLTCVECFVWISEHKPTFALYISNWLVFVTVLESVYSAVRTDYWFRTVQETYTSNDLITYAATPPD